MFLSDLRVFLISSIVHTIINNVQRHMHPHATEAENLRLLLSSLICMDRDCNLQDIFLS